MPDRRLGVGGQPDMRMADLLRRLQREVNELKRTRNRGSGVVVGLPFSMNDWTFDEVDGSLIATNPRGGSLSGGGEKGDPGDKGDKGDPGADGADGHSFLGGPGAPSVGLGNNGDFYVDETALGLWQKVSGAWSFVGAISADPAFSASDLGHRAAKIAGSSYMMPPMSNGGQPFDGNNLGWSTGGGTSFTPVLFPWQVTSTQIKYAIFRAGAAGTSLRIGIYAASLSTGLPTGVPTVLGTDSTLTAIAERTISHAAFTYQRNTMYWVAIQMQSSSNLRLAGAICQPAGWVVGVTGTIPNTWGNPATAGTVLGKAEASMPYAGGLLTNPTFAQADVRSSGITSVSGTPLVAIRADS